MNTEQIAKTCHEVNRAYCLSIGDTSQPTWEEAPDWQKKSAINGVNFHLSNPDSKPSDSHENWMNEKLADGWKYGPVKNPDLKEHPCIVPYDQLPKEQQTKDALFISVVRSAERQMALELKEDFDIGEDGCHYDLPMYEVIDGVGIVRVQQKQCVQFVRGSKLNNEDVPKRTGTLHEHLLAMMIHDLNFKNTLVPSREGSLVITKLQEALGWLRQRQADRIVRGVVGTYKK